MDNKPCQSPKCTVCGIPHECDYEFLQRELKEAKTKYNELLFAVETKFPDETRHETALRYIKEREAHCSGPHLPGGKEG